MNCCFVDFTTPDACGRRVVCCARCGLRLKNPVTFPAEMIHAECRTWPFWHEFGEWVAIALEAASLTPARYVWLRSRLGLNEVSASCGCDARKQWLNTFGGRLSQRTDRLGRWLYGLLVRRVRE